MLYRHSCLMKPKKFGRGSLAQLVRISNLKQKNGTAPIWKSTEWACFHEGRPSTKYSLERAFRKSFHVSHFLVNVGLYCKSMYAVQSLETFRSILYSKQPPPGSRNLKDVGEDYWPILHHRKQFVRMKFTSSSATKTAVESNLSQFQVLMRDERACSHSHMHPMILVKCSH